MNSTIWHAAKIQSLGALELWPFSCGLRNGPFISLAKMWVNSNACTLLWRDAGVGAFLEEAVIVLAMVISTWPSWCCRLDMLGQFHPICLLSALSMACDMGAGLMIITPPGMWTMSSSLVKPATAFRYLGSRVPRNDNMIRPKEAKPFQGDLDRRSWNRVITCNQNFVLSQQTLQLLSVIRAGLLM